MPKEASAQRKREWSEINIYGSSCSCFIHKNERTTHINTHTHTCNHNHTISAGRRAERKNNSTSTSTSTLVAVYSMIISFPISKIFCSGSLRLACASDISATQVNVVPCYCRLRNLVHLFELFPLSVVKLTIIFVRLNSEERAASGSQWCALQSQYNIMRSVQNAFFYVYFPFVCFHSPDISYFFWFIKTIE